MGGGAPVGSGAGGAWGMGSGAPVGGGGGAWRPLCIEPLCSLNLRLCTERTGHLVTRGAMVYQSIPGFRGKNNV